MTKANLSRRALLLGSLATGTSMAAMGGLGPLTRLARAGEGTGLADRYFVFCYFNGGWDILLSLDPRDPTMFHTENMAATRIHPGYDLLEVTDGQLVHTNAGITFGPAIGDLAAHASKLTVIRGMSMDTLTHDVGRRRFLTGKPPSGLQARGSSAATWLASYLGESQPVPNLAVRVESYNVDQPTYATGLSVSSVGDLLRTLDASGEQLSSIERQQIDELLRQHSLCPTQSLSDFQQRSESSRRRAHEMVNQQLGSLFNFMDPSMEALRDHYGITNSSQAQSSPQAQAALAAQALKGGVSRVVSIQVTSGLDTHYDNWLDDQPTRQMVGFSAVSRLIEDLEQSEYMDTGTSWLDHTTIVGFSEFSRTAMLNNSSGRDHALTNACFLLGGGIKEGQVVGRSSDVGLSPTKVSLQTGEADPGGEVVRPEHVIQALLTDIGAVDDPADLRVDPLRAILKSG